jgi:hypothetical protein
MYAKEASIAAHQLQQVGGGVIEESWELELDCVHYRRQLDERIMTMTQETKIKENGEVARKLHKRNVTSARKLKERLASRMGAH